MGSLEASAECGDVRAPEASRETAGEMRAAAVTEQRTATKADLVLTSPKISDGGGR